MEDRKRIRVDVVSDVACPWCYIGKKRLESAIEQLKGEFDFEVTFQPFQLDPSLPKAGMDRKVYFERKFGGPERVEEIYNRVEAAGNAVGIDFQFREIPKAINTLPLHLLLKKAQEEGIQTSVANALFDAYMVHPVDLSNVEVLQDIMQQFGWTLAKTKAAMEDAHAAQAVRQEISHYQQLGVSGVPFFIINQKYGISGAQPSEVFEKAFRSLQPEDFPKDIVNACDINGNC